MQAEFESRGVIPYKEDYKKVGNIFAAVETSQTYKQIKNNVKKF